MCDVLVAILRLEFLLGQNNRFFVFMAGCQQALHGKISVAMPPQTLPDEHLIIRRRLVRPITSIGLQVSEDSAPDPVRKRLAHFLVESTDPAMHDANPITSYLKVTPAHGENRLCPIARVAEGHQQGIVPVMGDRLGV